MSNPTASTGQTGIDSLPKHNHEITDRAERVAGCPLCSVLTEVDAKQSMYPTPDDPALDVPHSLNAGEWAARFCNADAAYDLDEDAVAAWFAAALRTGQQNPTTHVIQD